jgi:hypothetical protein
MPRPYDRPATIAAVANAAVVYLLPVAFAGVISLLPNRSAGTTVTAPDPDYLIHLANRLKLIVAYVSFMAPFAMVAAWRTFVHATRWLERGHVEWSGIVEAGATGLAGTLLVLLPGIVTHPRQAPGYVIAYGIPMIAIGLAIGVILHATALAVLKAQRAIARGHANS